MVVFTEGRGDGGAKYRVGAVYTCNMRQSTVRSCAVHTVQCRPRFIVALARVILYVLYPPCIVCKFARKRKTPQTTPDYTSAQQMHIRVEGIQ